jgi:hypothetical protein
MESQTESVSNMALAFPGIALSCHQVPSGASSGMLRTGNISILS